MANTNCKHCQEMRQMVRRGDKYWVIKCPKFPGEWRRLHDSCGSGWCERFEEKFGKRRGCHKKCDAEARHMPDQDLKQPYGQKGKKHE